VLIGKSSKFKSNLSSDILIGWVYKDLVQSYGQRLSLETSNVQKENRNLLFLSKDSSIIRLSSSSQGYALQEQECDISKTFENKSPVFKYETIIKGREKINVFKTGSTLNVFDKSKSFIYNASGTKIGYSDFCEMTENSKSINIVFAINQTSDAKEYMLVLNKAFQELSGLFEFKGKELNLRFGAIDCNSSNNGITFKIELSANYPEIINGIAKMLRKSIDDKNFTSGNSSIVNGLVNASKLLKGNEGQSNIIVMVSSQADNPSLETSNKGIKETALNELAKLNGRLLFMQPYCGTNPNYANFVQQAKLLIKSSSEKEAVLRKERMVGIEMDNSNLNNFRPILNGPNNIYCLDYPLNANNQGVLIFPTIGNKIDEKHFRAGLDTLLCQIVKDNESVINAISQVFDSPNSYNVKVNPNFQKYYSSFKPVPEDLSAILKNVDYQYFAPGYVAYNESSGTRPVKQSLFLSEEEYEEITNMFRELRLDEIGTNYDMKTRTASYQAILKVIRRYSDERQKHIQE
ncbi:MAG: hypothetical protein H7329_08625, partial [Opitutaceae bacterium]|nr:hypothetical protein [Cytophagales bacterium]